MKVLIVGAGARDHALAWKLGESPLASEIHVLPGNPAIASIATCHDGDPEDMDGVVATAVRLGIDFAIVGAEDFLVAGLASRLAQAGITCLGPSREAAAIEGSKSFAKTIMDEAGIPTAAWRTASTVEEGLAHVEQLGGAVAIKTDGLAAGRGAFVCPTPEAAEQVLRELLEERVFGDAGAVVEIEEMLSGDEVSAMVLCDGEHVVPLPPVRDYKRQFDGGRGPNTGGMGAVAPSPDMDSGDVDEIVRIAVEPAVRAMALRGTPFQGVLYVGVMRTTRGLVVLEFNCRMGNPETQALVRVLDADLLDLLHRTATGRLAGVAPPRTRGVAVAVCLATASYPEAIEEPSPVAVRGLAAARAIEGVEVFCSRHLPGPDADSILARGDRAVTVTAAGEDYASAAALAYEAAHRISFAGKQHRSDIGLVAPGRSSSVTHEAAAPAGPGRTVPAS